MDNNKNNNSYRVKVTYLLGMAILLSVFYSCGKMDENYAHFWEDGEIVYPAPADSAKAFPGKNRIGLSWIIIGDPNVASAKIFWNYNTDSVEIPIQASGKEDTITTYLTDLEERVYTFTIFTYDNKGNKSIPINVIGQSYGDVYSSSLLARSYVDATFTEEDELLINWGDPSEGSIGGEVMYLDTTGATKYVQIAPDAASTSILDYDFENSSTFSYRTAYIPSLTSIDTFYTDYVSGRVKGPIVDLPRTGWSITASSYDERHGTKRMPESAIDDNPSTIWVNKISTQTYYPHTLTVDMGSIVEGVEGVYIWVSNRNETPKNVRISVSEDGNEWRMMGLYSIAKASGKQYLEFSEPQDIRYFKMDALDSYGSPNIVIHEIGAFVR